MTRRIAIALLAILLGVLVASCDTKTGQPCNPKHDSAYSGPDSDHKLLHCGKDGKWR